MRIVTLLVVLFISLTISKNLYVSEIRGNDENSGTKESPLKTYAKAIKVSEPSDVIYFEPGTYDVHNLVTKSINIVGISEQDKRPLFQGAMYSINHPINISISGVNWENKEGSNVINIIDGNSVKLSNINFGPTSHSQSTGKKKKKNFIKMCFFE